MKTLSATAMPIAALMTKIVAGIDATTLSDVEDAQFVRRLATETQIDFNDLGKVKGDIHNAMMHIMRNGGGYTERVQQELAGAIASLNAQIGLYQETLDRAKLDADDPSLELAEHDGGQVKIDPAIAGQALRKTNGDGRVRA